MTQWIPDETQPLLAADERRREPRLDREGIVLLFPANARQPVMARLQDVSASGFRATHHYRQLESGERLRFRHQEREGEAVAVWKRVVNGEVESGFLILTAPHVWCD